MKSSAGSRTRAARSSPPQLAAFLLSFVLLAAFALPSWPVPFVRCEAVVGWNGVARIGRYAPLIVTVENPGRKLEVELRVEIARGGELKSGLSRRAYSRTVLVAGASARRVPFVVSIPNDPGPLEVGVFWRGERIARLEVDMRSVVTPERLIAGVSSEMSLDFLAALSDSGGNVRIVYPHVDVLPDSWAGYDGVEMVVVRDTSFQQLRSSQAVALERWIFSGGTLVFSGGAASFLRGSSGFDGLLPVEITGIRERDGLPSLAKLLQLPGGPRGSIILAESRVRSGKILAAEGGVPLLVQRRLGRGTIWFAAFDSSLPPFDSWQGTISLWRLLAERGRPLQERTIRTPAEDPWLKAFFDSPALSFPSRFTALGFSAAYLLFLLPLVFGRFSRLGGLPRVLFLSAVPVLACVAGYFLFNRILFRPQASLLESARVEAVSGDGLAFVTQKVELVSSAAGSFDLSIDSRDALVEESRIAPGSSAERKAPVTIATDDSGRISLRGVVLGRFEARLFTISGVVELPIEGTLAENGQSIAVTVKNSSGRSLRGSILARGGVAYLIGDVAPGETRSRTFLASEGVDLRDPALRAKVLGSVERAWLWERAYAASHREASAVTAWLDGPAFAVRSTPWTKSVVDPALTLLVMELR